MELRYVDLKAGRRLQVVAYDDTQAFTANHDPGAAPEAVDELLAEGFASWHVETAAETLQARVTKKGRLLVHRGSATTQAPPERTHDRTKPRLLPEDDPVLRELGISDAQGRVKPSRQAKYRQVEELVRALDLALAEAIASGAVRRPTDEQPLRVVDLGCGNAYLTFAAHRYLTAVLGLPVRTTGVDVKTQSRDHNSGVAERLGLVGETEFVVGGIDGWAPAEQPDVVLALHACDTATDDALAQAVAWGAPLVLAAPCCHHDLSVQLRAVAPPPGHGALLRDGILRERFADTLTDAVRALLLRTRGYRVDVVEFVDSAHTPRNTLLRAVRTGGDGAQAQAELDELLRQWPVRPALAERLR